MNWLKDLYYKLKVWWLGLLERFEKLVGLKVEPTKKPKKKGK